MVPGGYNDVIPLRRSDTPDLDDITGGPDPVPASLDGEHVEHLHKAYAHMTACARHLKTALALLDGGPLGGGGDDIDPVEFDPAVDDNPEGKMHRGVQCNFRR
jgi:hypothetical protein